MGNRVVVVFTNGTEYSPCIYLHWHASKLGDLLTKWRALMVGRENDLQYGAARFVGICHEAIEGNLSLGIWDSKVPHSAHADDVLCGHDPGDAGVVVVHVRTHKIRRLQGGENRAEWALRECPLPDGWVIPAATAAKLPQAPPMQNDLPGPTR